MRTSSRVVTIIGVFTVALSAPLNAQVITSDPSLPVLYPPGYYANLAGVGPSFVGSGLTIVLANDEHRALSVDSRTPVGPDEVELFQSTFLAQVSVNGSPFQPSTGSGPVQTVVHGKIGNTTGLFSTEMLSMSLSGSSPFGPFMIRESPTLASTGQTSISDLGGGNYLITSFFDIFTELSVDGGATWIPATGSVRMNLEQVPEPSSAALLVLGLLGSRIFLRRRSA